MKKVKVKVPATSANLGPGFDSLGIALEIYNEIVIEKNEPFSIRIYGEGAEEIVTTEENIVYQSAIKVLNIANKRGCSDESNESFRISLHNNIPSTRGLGSSSSAVVGGILGMNRLLGNPLSIQELLGIAVKFEGHPDNALPAFFGGLVASMTEEDGTVLWKKKLLPDEWRYVIVIPKCKLSTVKAREILPKTIPMKDAVFNLSRLSLLMIGFETGNYNLVAKSMKDKLHENYRASLIPGMEKAIQASRELEVPIALSGAGPTVIGIARNELHGSDLAGQMMNIFVKEGIDADCKIVKGNEDGAMIEEVE